MVAQQTTYQVKLNGTSNDHPTYESAYGAWQRITEAADGGRSVQAELWKLTVYPWCPVFYEGLLDPVTQTLDPEHFWAIPDKAIGSRHCIAALDYP